jgi:NADPH-dependent curcumin reductase CurA
VGQRLTMRGFIVIDHLDLQERFLRDMITWIDKGQMTWRETVYDGIARAPEALIGLFRGENFGKMLVKLSDDD